MHRSVAEKGVSMGEVITAPNQTVPAQMHRNLGPFEHLLWLVDQWTPRHFLLVSRIEGSSISAENLSAALLHSQRRHPLLRTAIHVNRDGTPEFIPSSAPIPLRVIPRANDTQWLHEVETELALPFAPDDRPLVRAVLVQGEAVSELILAVHHSIGDGVSAMYLTRDLLQSMEGHDLEYYVPSCPLFTVRVPSCAFRVFEKLFVIFVCVEQLFATFVVWLAPPIICRRRDSRRDSL